MCVSCSNELNKDSAHLNVTLICYQLYSQFVCYFVLKLSVWFLFFYLIRYALLNNIKRNSIDWHLMNLDSFFLWLRVKPLIVKHISLLISIANFGTHPKHNILFFFMHESGKMKQSKEYIMIGMNSFAYCAASFKFNWPENCAHY